MFTDPQIIQEIKPMNVFGMHQRSSDKKLMLSWCQTMIITPFVTGKSALVLFHLSHASIDCICKLNVLTQVIITSLLPS